MAEPIERLLGYIVLHMIDLHFDVTMSLFSTMGSLRSGPQDPRHAPNRALFWVFWSELQEFRPERTRPDFENFVRTDLLFKICPGLLFSEFFFSVFFLFFCVLLAGKPTSSGRQVVTW